MERLADFEYFWHIVLTVFAVVFSISTSVHAILFKRDHRAAVMWVAFIWFSPIVGAICYVILGVNRIRRRASKLVQDGKPEIRHDQELRDTEFLVERIEIRESLRELRNLAGTVTGRPLLGGNSVTLLENGDVAFPFMLEAINRADRSISLSSYIFDDDPSGHRFVEALTQATRRGVEVRVLIDDVGARYSRPPITRTLSRAGVRNARFLPQVWFLRFAAMNMRSHRKILVVDGYDGFMGGMNIRHGNCLRENPAAPIRDVHFRVQGPVVEQLQSAFTADWRFCTGEELTGDAWFPALSKVGKTAARVITDGPDEDVNKLVWTIHGALSCAVESIWIVTPYFLPDQSLIAAISTAALRGVRVNIVLPEHNNLKFIHAASRAAWWQILERGCRLWLTDGPFDHSKIMIVDDTWSLVGSANWDARSLRLNFEINLETYDEGVAKELLQCVQRKLADAREVTMDEVNRRTPLRRLLDGTARLFNPFL